MCRLLDVKRNRFYRYQQRDRSDDPVRRDMLATVKEIATASGDTSGSRRMKEALKVLTFSVSRHKARKLALTIHRVSKQIIILGRVDSILCLSKARIRDSPATASG